MTSDKPKGRTAVFISTVVGCSLVFAFIVTYILILKNAEIDLLERQVEQLSDVGAVPEVVEELSSEFSDLKDRLLPLTMVAQVDLVTGRCKFGGMDSPTDLSKSFSKAMKLAQEKKYDLALAEANAMEKELPNFLGPHYIRFIVHQDKGYADDAAAEAQVLIEAGSDDTRFSNVYMFLINHLLGKDKKKEAEDLALKALDLWPENEVLQDSFVKIFGYKPSKEAANKAIDGN